MISQEKVGEILVREGIVNKETLEKYLAVQKITKEPLLKFWWIIILLMKLPRQTF